MTESIRLKNKKNSTHVNISLNAETFNEVSRLRDELSEQMGFKFSYSQVIQFLINKGEKKCK